MEQFISSFVEVLGPYKPHMAAAGALSLMISVIFFAIRKGMESGGNAVPKWWKAVSPGLRLVVGGVIGAMAGPSIFPEMHIAVGTVLGITMGGFSDGLYNNAATIPVIGKYLKPNAED